MSYVVCSVDGRTAPCMCDCGHLSANHRVYERWRARCESPGCVCWLLDVCEHVQPFSDDSPDTASDAEILSELGIA